MINGNHCAIMKKMSYKVRNYLWRVKNTDARLEITFQEQKKTVIENNDDGTIKSEIYIT